MTAKTVFRMAGLAGALGVGLGAFGAHAMAGRLSPADLATFETGARYQMLHAVALLGLGAWMEQHPTKRLEWAARAFGIGILVFSGSLYVLVLTGHRWLGAITPLGGVSLIVGWLLVAAEGA